MFGPNLLTAICTLAIVCATLSGACSVRNELEPSRAFQTTKCTGCHGNADNSAPPTGPRGMKTTSEIGVGAHQQHLKDGDLRAAVKCSECHKVPREWNDSGHIDSDLPAEITWGELATAAGADPEWERKSKTCSNTYCHGASVSGGETKDPMWTTVDGSQKECNSCHGYPPPAPHLASTACNQCHPDTVDNSGRIIVANKKHINGSIDVAGKMSCNFCHGGKANAAPPTDLAGNTDTTFVGVGAHQSHLNDGFMRKALDCSDCHKKPKAVGDSGHANSAGPAELTFGELSRTDESNPTWDRKSKTCSNTYCHGATISGGDNTKPVWTKVDGSQAYCGSCHGYPPPAPHVQNSNCQVCHRQTVDSDGMIDIAAGKHINGTLDLTGDLSCNSCHGGVNNAPPSDLNGNIATTEIGVGAHQSHLQKVECAECHKLPQKLSDKGHIDLNLPAELSWGALAKNEGVKPTWDRSTKTCSNTYCHGTTLMKGGKHTIPVWTQVDGSQKTCDSCHGNPPVAPHTTSQKCNFCHDLSLHLSGAVEFTMGRNKFVIAGPASIESGVCKKFTVTSYDPKWNPQPTVRDTTVKFYIIAGGSQAKVYSEAGCTTEIDRLNVPADMNSFFIYFKDTVAEKVTLKVATTSWTWRERPTDIDVR